MMRFEEIRYGLPGMADTHAARPFGRFSGNADPGWRECSAPPRARERFVWLRAKLRPRGMFARVLPQKARARLAG